MQPAFAAGRASHNGTAFNARPVGAVSTAKLLIQTHGEHRAITETACDTSRRRTTRGQDRSHMSDARAVGAVSTAKLLIQNPQWSTGLLPRQPAIPTGAEQLVVKTAPTRQCTPRGSGLDREAFDPKPTMEHRAITETACDTSRRRTTRGQYRSHTSNARPWERSRPRSF